MSPQLIALLIVFSTTWFVIFLVMEGKNHYIKHFIENWIVSVVVSQVVLGGHCGCCGKWVPHCLVSHRWQVTICWECASGAPGHTCTKWEKGKVVNIASAEEWSDASPD